jgi:hypothetical protein
MTPHPTAIAPSKRPHCTPATCAAALADCTTAADDVAIPDDEAVVLANTAVVEGVIVAIVAVEFVHEAVVLESTGSVNAVDTEDEDKDVEEFVDMDVDVDVDDVEVVKPTLGPIWETVMVQVVVFVCVLVVV